MFLLDWYRQYLEIRNDNTICQSCENLKLELARSHDRERELLSALTNPKQAPEKEPIDVRELKPILPARHHTFGMRRQMLEAEDRRRAEALRQNREDAIKVVKDETKIESPIPEASTEVDSNLTAELEAELDVVATEREEQSGKRTGTE